MGFKRFYLNEERLHVDTKHYDKSQYEKVMRCLNKKGYDLRNVEEVKNLYNRMNSQGGVDEETFPDHYQCALKFLTTKEKQTRSPEQNIITRVAKFFGITNDMREAGYILPSGALLDMSGKREGQMPGMRSFDHREIGGALENIDHPVSFGGTEGMLNFMSMGPIRIEFNSGSIHIHQEPNAKQYSMLRYFISSTPSDYISVDIEGKSSKSFEPFEKRNVLGYIRKSFGT